MHHRLYLVFGVIQYVVLLCLKPEISVRIMDVLRNCNW